MAGPAQRDAAAAHGDAGAFILFEKIAVLFDVRREVERVLAHQPFGQLGVAGSSASMIRMWSMIERAARSLCEIVIRRMARTWMNRSSIVLPIRCEPESRMIA